MTNPTLYRRVLRRETHSPRAALAVFAAVLLILAFAWIGTESVLELLGRPPLLVSPGEALLAANNLPTAVITPAIVGAGVVAAIVGLVFVAFAVLPGRRARHTGVVGRTAVVVDNAVIASALARTASNAANIDPDQVTVTIGHRTADVRVRPTSGFSVNEAAIASAVEQQLDDLELTPSVRSKVTIERKGVVGA